MNTKKGMPAMRFRKNTKRAVSPIIATILLVAITVVLAAVLYVLISGLIHGPGNTPIGSALGIGGATLVTCGAGSQATTGCTGLDYAYTITISSASTGVTLSSVNFQVLTSSGTVAAPAGGTDGFAVTSISGGTLAWIHAMSFTTWGAYVAPGTASTQVVTSDTIWVDMGLTNSPAGQDYSLVIYGTGSYSGSESVTLP